MNILVTGSLGNISQPLTQELLQKGHAVTVISSNPAKQQAIEALGATPAIGALQDADFLKATFVGADAVYAMVPPNPAAPDNRAYYQALGHSYAQAIQQSGVRRVVHLSSMGADLAAGTGLILGSHDVEGILNKLPGLALTHLRPGYFYSNLTHMAGMIKAMGCIAANYGGADNLVMVDPRDIAAAAAEELTLAASPGQHVRYVASGEYTGNEAAQALGTAIGKPDLAWVVITDEQARGGMQNSGMPAPLIENFLEMGASIHSGALRQDYDRHKPQTMGKVKLADFAKEFAAAF